MMVDDVESGNLGPYRERPRTFPSTRSKSYVPWIFRVLMGINVRVLIILLVLGLGAIFYMGATTSPTIVFVFTVCIISFLLSVYLTKWVLSKDEGPPEMVEIADAIRDGAEGFLRTQYGTISKMALILALVILCIYLFHSPTPHQESSGLGRSTTAFITVAAFLLGALCSGSAGYIGMWVSVRANVRVSSAARRSAREALQLQKDRKLGSAFVRTRFPAVDKFLGLSGHITMLELCQAPPVERYLHDLLQYALGVLHIATLVFESRKMIVNCTLSNNRVGIAVILDAANIASNYVDPEIIQPGLNVLINLVCPPPSISNRPPLLAQGQQSVSLLSSNALAMETRDRNTERNISDRAVNMPPQNDPRERNGESGSVDRGIGVSSAARSISGTSQTPVPTATSGLVGDRRIYFGTGAGCAGRAAQMEQVYRQAREAVRANNGIKVLLHLLQSRIYSPPAALDCIRALACRVLLGLARDDSIAHILTKLQSRQTVAIAFADPKLTRKAHIIYIL